MAVSGIDNTIKVFSPDRRAQEDARHGISILNPDHPANSFTSRARQGGNGPPVRGLRTCKRMHESYQIMSQNDVDRQGGMSDAYITVWLFLFLFSWWNPDIGSYYSTEKHASSSSRDIERAACSWRRSCGFRWW
jgi:hypothetical protein